MTEPDHQAKARDFVDRILELNRRHGVDKDSAVIEYDHAVRAAINVFRHLRREKASMTDEAHSTKSA